MFRTNPSIVMAAAIAIGSAGCGPSDSSAPSDQARTLEVAREQLSTSTSGPRVQIPTPPDSEHPTEELTPPPAAPAIETNAVRAALGDPKKVAILRGLALQIASSAGVSAPLRMSVVAAADHQDAATIISGAIINDHAPVYVITMTGGRFTAVDHPPGAPAPQGSVLTVTVDAATYRVTDVGIVNAEPDLSRIALVTSDLGAK